MTFFDEYLTTKDDLAKSDEEYMQTALKLAQRAKSQGEVSIGATLAMVRSHLSEHSTESIDPLHTAGMNVLNKALSMLPYKVEDGVLYCTLEPDVFTVTAANKVGINEVVFGAYDPKDGFVSSKSRKMDLEVYDVKYRGGVLAEECFDILPKDMKEYCATNPE